MATIVHDDVLNGMLGNPTHSVIDCNTDNMDASLLDQTDSGTITSSFVDYDEVDAATVVATAGVPSGTITGGVWDIGAAITFSAVTGDAADYLTIWKNSGTPATSPLFITWDSASTGLPVTPNGGDITATFTGNDVVTLAQA